MPEFMARIWARISVWMILWEADVLKKNAVAYQELYKRGKI